MMEKRERGRKSGKERGGEEKVDLLEEKEKALKNIIIIEHK